jgi:hypothetical protein
VVPEIRIKKVLYGKRITIVFLNAVWKHNKENESKKYMFLICHSFQLACIYWDLAEVTKENLILSELCLSIRQKPVKKIFY